MKIKGIHQDRVMSVLKGVLLLSLLACYGWLGSLPDLRAEVPKMLGLTAISTIVLSVLYYYCANQKLVWSPTAILIMAAAFRLIFIFNPPQLSDDIHRYLFDGHQLLTGHNPYAVSPEIAARQDPTAAELVADVNHPHLVTIYPPAAQMFFAAGAMGRNIFVMKLLLIASELIGIALMIQLLRQLSLPPDRAILYAWHPLPVLEIASSGHLDGVCLMIVFAAMYLIWPKTSKTLPKNTPTIGKKSKSILNTITNCIRYRHPIGRQAKNSAFWSGFLFATAILIKLLPIVFLPLYLYLIQPHCRKYFLFGLAVNSLILIVPFYPDICNMLTTLKVYATSWEFSGLAFRVLRQWLQSGYSARVVLSVAFSTLCLYAYIAPFRRIQGASSVNQQLFGNVLRSSYLIAFVFLWTTPTLHPWYGLYMIALMSFYPETTGMILSWTITLGYHVLIPEYYQHQWIESDIVPFLIWSGPILALLFKLHNKHKLKKC